MKKKFFCIILLIFLFGILCFYFNFFSSSKMQAVVNYNGANLRISIDGADVTTLPTTGTYYLTNYVCDNSKTKVIWDNDKYELVFSDGKDGGGISCDITLKSNPLLSEMPVGSYVVYEGKGGTLTSENGSNSIEVKCQNDTSLVSPDNEQLETESPQSCLGKNARIDKDTTGYTYGYCNNDEYRYYVQGWRIAYIDDNTNKVAIISAGSPECNNRPSSTNNETYIKKANALALKYCNPNFVDGDSNGNKCTCVGIDSDSDGRYDQCSSISADAWAINDDTFNKMTEQATGVTGGGYLYNSINGATKCGEILSMRVCGYKNDLIDIGGYYWFAASSGSNSDGVFWRPSARYVYYRSSSEAYGLRPVISLSSSVYVTGGKGTMNNPYTICNTGLDNCKKIGNIQSGLGDLDLIN